MSSPLRIYTGTRMMPALPSHKDAEPVEGRELRNDKVTQVCLTSENWQYHFQQRKIKNCACVTSYSNWNKTKMSVTLWAEEELLCELSWCSLCIPSAGVHFVSQSIKFDNIFNFIPTNITAPIQSFFSLP